jgi:hypothetical protein
MEGQRVRRYDVSAIALLLVMALLIPELRSKLSRGHGRPAQQICRSPSHSFGSTAKPFAVTGRCADCNTSQRLSCASVARPLRPKRRHLSADISNSRKQPAFRLFQLSANAHCKQGAEQFTHDHAGYGRGPFEPLELSRSSQIRPALAEHHYLNPYCPKYPR